MNKKKSLYQQDNRVSDQRDTLSRLPRNIVALITKELQSQYPTLRQNDKTILHAYDMNNIKDETITITDEQLRTISGHNSKVPSRNIAYYKNLLDNLRVSRCDLPADYRKNKWITVGWIDWAERDEEEKSFKVQISRKVIPYILNLAANYTSIDYNCIVEIKNPFANRFYQKCCQFRRTGWFKMTETEIRENFCVYRIDSKGKRTTPKYTNSSQFRAKVLEVSKKELKDKFNKGLIDYYFEYLPTKWMRGNQHPYEWIFAIGWAGHKPDFKKGVEDIDSWKAQKAEKKSEPDLFANYAKMDSSMALNGILVMIKTYFPKDVNFYHDIELALSKQPTSFIEHILRRIFEMSKKYKPEIFPGCLRKMLSEDVLKIKE